jgi:uncharacterized protein with PIN domain
MIVILETTFIVEVVLEQDEADACEKILSEASDAIRLVLPAFSIAEAGMMLERRRGERRDFIDHELARHSKDVSRSKVLARYSRTLGDLEKELFTAQAAEAHRFSDFCSRRFETVDLSEQILMDAINFRSMGIMERLPDAIVLGSVLAFLDAMKFPSSEAICFVTRDAAFGARHVNELLRGFGCKYLGSFNAALGWIQKYNRPSN